MEAFDLVVVGAGMSIVKLSCVLHVLLMCEKGIHGLAALKTYRDVHPRASILVLEKAAEIGGVWAKERLYPGLHTNNHFRT